VHSLETRLVNEQLFLKHALESPVFGWAQNFFPTSAEGRIIGVPDGMWIITMSRSGLLCLIAGTVALLLPSGIMMLKIPRQYVRHPSLLVMWALALVAALHMCDNLMNAMENPVYLLCAGGVMTVAMRPRFWASAIMPGSQAPPAASTGERRLWRSDGSSAFFPPAAPPQPASGAMAGAIPIAIPNGVPGRMPPGAPNGGGRRANGNGNGNGNGANGSAGRPANGGPFNGGGIGPVQFNQGRFGPQNPGGPGPVR
jgi:hypothetical protein